MTTPAASRRPARVATWDAIVELLETVRRSSTDADRLDRMVELLVHLRLLGQDLAIVDGRQDKDDIESLHARVRDALRDALAAFEQPSPEAMYLLREALRKLPVRDSSSDLIEEIRTAAEAFEESRDDADPLMPFAGDLRKEVHRRLSPRILERFLVPYRALVRDGNRAPLAEAGYPVAAGRFVADDEDPAFVRLADELYDKLAYLWDYAEGDVAAARRSLEARADLFRQCFLPEEIGWALGSLLNPAGAAAAFAQLDVISRLTKFRDDLRLSFREGRVALYDIVIVELDFGALLFTFANDLANRHYADVTTANVREALDVVNKLKASLVQDGLDLPDQERFDRDLESIRDTPVLDLFRLKRCVAGIAGQLKDFLQQRIIGRMGPVLNAVLEAYEVPTTRLSPVKTRFFNGLIRRTNFHVLSEFLDKIVDAIDRELARQSDDEQLHPRWRLRELPPPGDDPDTWVADTWTPVAPSLYPLLGGKGNSLVDMSEAGLPVPPAFILGLPVCTWVEDGIAGPDAFRDLVRRHLSRLEARTGLRLGDPDRPLLVSVRSGAPMSMPGSMATLLNVGMTEPVRQALAARHGERFADGLRARFLGNVIAVLEPPDDLWARGTQPDPAGLVDPDLLAARVRAKLGAAFLDDPLEQLVWAIRLVFASSRSPAAQAFRSTLSSGLPPVTAASVQQMVFGNRNANSLSGVLLTRNPVTGQDELFGEFVDETQGEDVVMGNRIGRPVSALPDAIRAGLDAAKEVLEQFYRRELDLEFTVDDGTLWLLQARRARLGPFARLATDAGFLRRGAIGLDEFRGRLERLAAAHDSIAIPREDPDVRRWNPPIAEGVPLNGGVVSGTLVLSPEGLKEATRKRETIIFLAFNTKPIDFHIMNESHAIVNVYPGRTSHAAITAMTLNKPCIVGCEEIEVDIEHHRAVFRGREPCVLREGEHVTIDANTGAVYRGPCPLSNTFLSLSNLADRLRDLADPDEAADRIDAEVEAKLQAVRRETGLRRSTLADLPPRSLDGAFVLVRADLNVPVADGRIQDTARIDDALPTIRAVLERGGTPVVCSHLGDPGAGGAGRTREQIYQDFSLRPVAEALAAEFPGALTFHEASVATSGLLLSRDDLVPGHVNLLENLRFASGEKENDDGFARSLAGLSDGWFVNDAFNVCHRRHASITGVPGFCRHRLAGPLVANELDYLRRVLEDPPRPFVAFLGGTRVSSQMGLLESLLQRVDAVHLGGGLGNSFLRARGDEVGRSRIDASAVEPSRFLLSRYGDRLALPVDFTVLMPDGTLRAGVSEIPPEGRAIDVGPATIAAMDARIAGARTVLWSGPVGVIESDDGVTGTRALAASLARRAAAGATVILCGHDTSVVARATDVDPRVWHLSTGGAAFLEFVERLTLPGIAALDPG